MPTISVLDDETTINKDRFSSPQGLSGKDRTNALACLVVVKELLENARH